MSKEASEDIFTLIRSLSKSEKRYFAFYAAIGNATKGKLYLRLFHVIDKQKKYDEKKILQKIPELKPQQFSNQKKYLEELVFESLRWYHSRKSIDAQLMALISEIEVLYKKNLFRHCAKQIKKAKALAQRYEKYNLLTEIIRWEEALFHQTFSTEKRGKEIDKLLTANMLIVEKIKKNGEYRIINNEIFQLHNMGGVLLNKSKEGKIKGIIQRLLIRNGKKTLSYREHYHHYHILGACYYMLGNWKKSYAYQKKNVGNFETHPSHIDESPQLYFNSLGNFLISCGQLGKEAELENTFLKVKHLMQNLNYSSDSKLLIQLFMCCISVLHHYSDVGEFQKGILLSNKIEGTLNNLDQKIDKGRKLIFYYIFALNYFGAGNYKRSIFWLNKILNDKNSDVRNDIQVFARLLNLIIHFEFGNDSELDYFTKSTYRFLLSKKRQYKIETVVIQFIRKKIPKANSMKQLLLYFGELKSHIEKITKDPLEQRALTYFDFISWLESKITGRSFADVVKEKWKSSK